MTIQEAMDMVLEEYIGALQNAYVNNPVAYALYQVWKKADAKPPKKPTDLTGKCGSCEYAKPTSEFGSNCYIYCSNRDMYRQRKVSYFKQRTTRACKRYKPKGE